MTTIVWGHGSRSRGDEKTFVPAGTTVKWFADLDENLLTRNGFLALSSGDFGAPNDSQGPGVGTTVEILNYEVFADLEKRDKVAILHRGDSSLKFVGAEVAEGPLCTDPPGCLAAGRHGCSGLLGTVADTEIVILVCRGLPGGDTATESFGTDSVTIGLNEDFGLWFKDWIAGLPADPDGTMTNFESYSDPVKLQVGTYLAVPVWQAVHWASSYAAAGQYSDAVTQFRENPDPATVSWFLSNVPTYAQRFGQGAAADSTAFFAALDTAPPDIAEIIRRLPEVEGARQGAAQQGFDDFAAGSWVPTDSDIAGVTDINRDTVKSADEDADIPYIVAGFVTLIGDRHGAEWTDWAATEPDCAHGTLTVARATFGAGKIKVSDCPPAKQAVVEHSLNAFSDKEVRFV